MRALSRALLVVAVTLMLAPLPAGAAGGLESAPEAPSADPPAQAQAVHHVHMVVSGGAFLFDPPVVQAAAGDTIVFHSHDIPHTATSGIDAFLEPVEALAPADANLNTFDTGMVGGGSSASVTLGDSGEYPYYCSVGLHRFFGMHATIVVA